MLAVSTIGCTRSFVQQCNAGAVFVLGLFAATPAAADRLPASSASALAFMYSSPGPIDRGGLIMSYLLENDRPQRIEGTCISACTLKLGARHVCVVAGSQQSPKTILWFHGPSGQGERSQGIYLMRKAYARFPRVAAWVNSRGVLNSRDFLPQNRLERQAVFVNRLGFPIQR